MQNFIGTKLIKAKPMNRLDYNIYRGWELPADENGADEGQLVEYLDGGKSNHPDHEGYISWSPQNVFEKAYKTTTEGMTFGNAVTMAKLGNKVTRKGWNGSGMYCYVVPEHTTENSGPECLDVPYIYHDAHWIIKTAQGSLGTWAPSNSDSLAEDWMVVE